MNPFLAELYDTAENIGTTKTAGVNNADEQEKLAQATVIDQMLQAEGSSFDKLAAPDILKVATELFGADSPLAKAAAEACGEEAPSAPPFPPKKEKKDEEEAEKEAREKLAEADFLGRAMAHAYVSELRNIEKQASAGQPGQPGQTKQASALDILATQRAEAILKEAGVSNEQEKLAQAVEQRALEILKAKGYTVG